MYGAIFESQAVIDREAGVWSWLELGLNLLDVIEDCLGGEGIEFWI